MNLETGKRRVGSMKYCLPEFEALNRVIEQLMEIFLAQPLQRPWSCSEGHAASYLCDKLFTGEFGLYIISLILTPSYIRIPVLNCTLVSV